MADEWTRERVLQLAPDPASAKAGEGLASARKWVSVQCEQLVLWGECQGSGAKPYQVQVDLSEPAFKCTCPSRKFPCKHSLGLMLIFAAGQVPAGTKPAWVEQWISSRADREQKKQSKAQQPAKPPDPEAQARRQNRRMDRIVEGLATLRVWVEDLVRGGIATAPTRGYSFFDEPARRMVDAQAPGAGRLVRELGSIAMSGAGWQTLFVQRLAELHLMLRAAERIKELGQGTVEDLMAALGIPAEQDAILAQAGVGDRWQVIAQEIEVEDRLRVQRSWLFGMASRRVGLVLHFAHGAGPLDASLQPGTLFDGECCFFPGHQTRAAVKSRAKATSLDSLSGCETLDAACRDYAAILAIQPWAGEVVFPLDAVVPVAQEQRWYLVDRRGQALPAAFGGLSALLAAALSGGRPIDVAAGWDGRRMRPIAALAAGQYVPLRASASVGD
jgi:hypothetical protein